MNGMKPSSYWVIIRDVRDRMEVLTLWLTGQGEALPVFSFGEDARNFCERRGLESGWHGKEISIEELALVLCGLCADVERIALDPLPQTDAEMLVALTYMRCEDFLTFLFRENTSHVNTADTQGPARATLGGARSDGQPDLDDPVPPCDEVRLPAQSGSPEALSHGAHRTAGSTQPFGYGSASTASVASTAYPRETPPASLWKRSRA